MLTQSEKQFILDNCHILKDAQIAAAISKMTGRHVSQQVVRAVRRRNGIRKAHGNGVCRVVSRIHPLDKTQE